MKTSINAKIVQTQNAIENTIQHTEIFKKLSTYGYDRKRLLEGKALNETVRMLQMEKYDKYGEQYDSTDAMEADLAQLKIIYKEHVTLARMAFDGKRGIQERLQIIGPRKNAKEAWLAQARAFYGNLEEIEDPMSKYGITPEVLSQTRAMVEALFASRQHQLTRIGEAQAATQRRDEAIKARDIWMHGFRQVARLALREDPQLLEVLGIKVPSKRV